MFSLSSKGDFRDTEAFLQKMVKLDIPSQLATFGERGVQALAAATPTDSGVTASSWTYEVKKLGYGYSLEWHNTNVNNGVNIAIILQYGHGTGTGGYVQGRDYINPAIQPIMDQIAEEVWKVVTSS